MLTLPTYNPLPINASSDAKRGARASGMARSRRVASVQNYDDLTHCYPDDSNSVNVHVPIHALLSNCKIRNPLDDRVRDPLAPAACPAILAIVPDGTGDRSSGFIGVGRGDVLGGSGVGGA